MSQPSIQIVQKLKKLQSQFQHNCEQFQFHLDESKNSNIGYVLWDYDSKQKYLNLKSKYDRDFKEFLKLQQQWITDPINAKIEMLISEYNHPETLNDNTNINTIATSNKNKRKRFRECNDAIDTDQTSTTTASVSPPPHKRQKNNIDSFPVPILDDISSNITLNDSELELIKIPMISSQHKKNKVQSDAFDYDINEWILCYDVEEMLYQAKVLKRKICKKSNEALYFVHYKRWNNKWDEWVSDDRCLRKTKANLNKMKQYNKNKLIVLQNELKKSKKDSSDDGNENICNKCGKNGDLVLCDGCPHSFHIECIGLDEIPDDDYYCKKCVKKGKNKKRKRRK